MSRFWITRCDIIDTTSIFLCCNRQNTLLIRSEFWKCIQNFRVKWPFQKNEGWHSNSNVVLINKRHQQGYFMSCGIFIFYSISFFLLLCLYVSFFIYNVSIESPSYVGTHDVLPLLIINMSSRPYSRDMLHVVFMRTYNRLICFIKGHNVAQQHRSDLFFFFLSSHPLRCVRRPPRLLPFSPFSHHLIYPASRPWGGTALGRLLTQEKRAFNVMSLCRKAWQNRGPGHLLQDINTSPSSFSECNGLDITSPVGHYGPWIINPLYGVRARVSVCAYVCLNEHRVWMRLHMYVARRCVCYSGGFTRTVWGNLSPREKVIHYLHTSFSWKQQGSRKSQLHKPLPSPCPPSPPPPPPLAPGDTGPVFLLPLVFQGLPLASGWVWEGTAT